MCKCIGLIVHVSKAFPDTLSNSSDKYKHCLKVARKCEYRGRRDLMNLKVHFMQERVLFPHVCDSFILNSISEYLLPANKDRSILANLELSVSQRQFYLSL